METRAISVFQTVKNKGSLVVCPYIIFIAVVHSTKTDCILLSPINYRYRFNTSPYLHKLLGNSSKRLHLSFPPRRQVIAFPPLHQQKQVQGSFRQTVLLQVERGVFDRTTEFG